MKIINVLSSLCMSVALVATGKVAAQERDLQETAESGQSVASTAEAAEGSVTKSQGAQKQELADNQIETIVITAQRVISNLQTTPVAVSAITGQALEDKQVANITALQYSVPTLQIAAPKDGDSSGANIGLRGQIQTYSSITVDPSVGLYIDGIYVARNAGAALDLVDMERVEVLRGPQGTLFGRNTTGGAVNLIPNKPQYDSSGQLKAGYGNYGFWEVQGMVNVPVVTDQVALRTVYQHKERGGWGKSLQSGQEFGDQDSHYLRTQLLIEPEGSRLSVLVSADGSWSVNNGSMEHPYFIEPSSQAPNVVLACANDPTRVNCPAGLPPIFDAGDGFYTNRSTMEQKNHARALGLGATVEYRLDAVTLKSISSYRNLERAYAQDLDGTAYSLLDIFRGYIDQQQTSQELQLLGTAFDDRLSWITGAYYFSEKGQDLTDSNSLAPVATTRTVKDVYGKNDSIGGYGHLSYEMVKDVRMTAGLRYTKDTRYMDKVTPTYDLVTGQLGCAFQASGITGPGVCQFIDEVDFDYWSWNLGPDWQVNDSVFVYAKASKGFRSGGLNQGGVNQASLIPFSPESVMSYEVGAKLDLFNRRLRANIDYYFVDYDDVQRATVRVIDNRSSNFVVNAASARIQGVEAELTAKPFTGFTIAATFGMTDAKYQEFTDPYSGADRTHEEFPQVPKYTAGGSADYVIPLQVGSLLLHLDYGWRSEQYYETTEASKVGAYGLWNGLVSLQLENSGVQLSLWGRNLSGEQYYQSATGGAATSLGYASGYPGEPRMYGVSATYRF